MEQLFTTLGAGALFGAGAGLLLVETGRTAGISGVLKGALGLDLGDRAWRWMFLLGLLLGGAVLAATVPTAIARGRALSVEVLVLGGLCIGVGARLANGCTSGHGICGVGRLSVRSLAAVAIFTVSGAVTRLLLTHAAGGPQ